MLLQAFGADLVLTSGKLVRPLPARPPRCVCLPAPRCAAARGAEPLRTSSKMERLPVFNSLRACALHALPCQPLLWTCLRPRRVLATPPMLDPLAHPTHPCPPRAQGMTGAIRKAEEIVKTMPNAYMLQQFDNPGAPRTRRPHSRAARGGGRSSAAARQPAADVGPTSWQPAVAVGARRSRMHVLRPRIPCPPSTPHPSRPPQPTPRCTTSPRGPRSGGTPRGRWTSWWRAWAPAAPLRVGARAGGLGGSWAAGRATRGGAALPDGAGCRCLPRTAPCPRTRLLRPIPAPPSRTAGAGQCLKERQPPPLAA